MRPRVLVFSRVFLKESSDGGLVRHGRSGAGFGDGEGGDGAAVLGGGGEVPFVGDEAGGKAADEGVTGAGGVDGFDLEGGDFEVAIGARDEDAAGAEGDDDDGHADGRAERVELGGGELEQRGLGEGGAVRFIEPIDEINELGFIGDDDVDVLEHGGLKLRPERGGIENSEGACFAPEFEGVGAGGEVGLELGDNDAGVSDRLERQVGFGEAVVGGKDDDDLVLAGVVDEDGSGAGGGGGFDGPFGADALGFVEGFRVATEGIIADGTDVEGGSARSTGSDRLIGAFATGAREGGAGEGLSGLGKFGAPEGEIDYVAADDDDLGRGFHATTVEVVGRGDKTRAPFVLGELPFVQSLH